MTENNASPARPHPLYWEVTTLVGIVPNVVLAGCGLLIGVSGFVPSVVYAAGAAPSTFFLLAAVLAGAGALNVSTLCRAATRHEPILHWAAVSASSSLVLWAVWLWKDSFETYGSLTVPVESMSLGVIGILSDSALVWACLASGPTLGLSLRQVGNFAVGLGLFLVLASVIVRPNRFGDYRDQAPIARHFQELGGTVHWDEWNVTGILLISLPVEDGDLEPISRLPAIRSIDLSDTRVGEGMEYLSSATTLESLILTNAAVSDAGLASIADWLHERLPRCSIYGTPEGEGYRVDRADTCNG